MKKIFFSVLAIAAIAACTKSEVQYDAPQEIGFAPAVKNITKGAMEGSLSDANPDQKLGVWAYWNVNENGILTDSHDYVYLDNATFAQRDNGANWGGWDDTNSTKIAYPWPVNGTLRFAGYTKKEGLDVNYVASNDEITFNGYTAKADGFDLCWFGATQPANHKNENTTVTVELSHALTWLSFLVNGNGLPATDGWKIKTIVLNDIATVGNGVCVGNGTNKAEWDITDDYQGDITLFNALPGGELIISTEEVNIEGTDSKGKAINNILLIPQEINPKGQSSGRTNHTLTITYDFPVGDSWKTDVKTVNLDLTENYNDSSYKGWMSGVHYIYKLTFTGNEILLTPSYDAWEDVNETVTVE